MISSARKKSYEPMLAPESAALRRVFPTHTDRMSQIWDRLSGAWLSEPQKSNRPRIETEEIASNSGMRHSNSTVLGHLVGGMTPNYFFDLSVCISVHAHI